MQTNKVIIDYKSKKDEFYFIPIGDTHLGNRGCEVQRIKDLIDWMKTKENCYWIGMGDYLDCINYTDTRFDPKTVEPKYLDDLSNCVAYQTEDFIELFQPIKDKCIGLHRGNHEEAIRLRYHFDVMHELYKAWKKPILEDTAVTVLNFIRQKRDVKDYKIYSLHGRVGGRRGGNKINWLEDFIAYFDADIYLMAHAHIKESEIKTQLYIDRAMHVRQKKKVLCVTGSFLRGYTEGSSSYVEKWMLPPTDLGVIRLSIKPFKGDIHVSI